MREGKEVKGGKAEAEEPLLMVRCMEQRVLAVQARPTSMHSVAPREQSKQRTPPAAPTNPSPTTAHNHAITPLPLWLSAHTLLE